MEDAAIKERNPNAWALTSGGRIYISGSIPAELADVVGCHEADPENARAQFAEMFRDYDACIRALDAAMESVHQRADGPGASGTAEGRL